LRRQHHAGGTTEFADTTPPPPGPDTHTNTTGYGVVAQVFEEQLP
jgi:hypothetical protein